MAAKSKQSIATRTTWVFRGIIWHDTIHVDGKPQSLAPSPLYDIQNTLSLLILSAV
ncbi:hypothetical protein FOZG_09876 [Fusarium oxysporum Fo47]|uniref:Uncharacterized protein n=1 Tax=Fusarium oxysporum Fo47 TaxID=660027 RepID=W9K9T6_FUSOX|nr:hypothetical protein FOZG_09876 [Fusarium oxysporum Fo47]